MIKKIYLAGPCVFRPDAIAHGENLKQICAKHGFEGVFPFDNDGAADTAKKIYQSNVSLLNKCDIIIANIQAFHGPSMDVGTAWEIGYAAAAGKVIIVYTLDHRTHREKVDDMYGPLIEGKYILNAADGSVMSFDDFGEIDNLMISCSAEFITYTFEEAVLYAKEKYGPKKIIADTSSKNNWDTDVEPHWNFVLPPSFNE